MSTFRSLDNADEECMARTEPEPAIEPDLPTVDPQLHLWDLNGKRHLMEEYARDLAAAMVRELAIDPVTSLKARG